MAINYNTKIVTTTPYNIVPSDEVIFVNVSGPSSIILPIVSGGDKKAFRRR